MFLDTYRQNTPSTFFSVTTQLVTDHSLLDQAYINTKKQVHPNEQEKPDPETEEYTVGCVLCGLEFSSEEACNEHDCPACKKAKATVIKKEPKVEPEDGNISNRTHSSRGRK